MSALNALFHVKYLGKIRILNITIRKLNDQNQRPEKHIIEEN